MAGEYLGEFDRKVETPDDAGKIKWALDYIMAYGGIDGAHHKDWVLDQVVRILNGTRIETCVAKWDCGTENLRFNTLEPSQDYIDWVDELKSGCDGPETYGYDEGIPP